MSTDTKLLFDLYFTGEYEAIPERMRAALERYVYNRIPPGDFLQAVLQNDLQRAVTRADSDNLKLLPLYVRWLYNVAPAPCWGSPARYEQWVLGKDMAKSF
jgi:hypothetical protein